MDYDDIIKKYEEADKDLSRYERENELRKGSINVLASDLKVLKASYKEAFGVESDEDTLLFGRRVIEIKL